jgi:NADH dehydrogenase/NADH:ubiquinone oxidoreductase subunit G
MSKQFFSTAILSSVIFMACNNNETKNEHDGHNMKDSTTQSAAVDEKEIKQVPVLYTNVDATAAASIKLIVDYYLHIKNALSNDNADEAAAGGKSMAEAIQKVDKSLLTPDQKKAYDEITSELQDHGEHVEKNAADIKHQRSHFILMSEDIYSLVKAFGGGRPLYHDHCPMANDNKGAMWISEIKEVKNPYFGASMLTCGSVEEVIK